MGATITVNADPATASRDVSLRELQELARQSENPNADRSDIAGITVPKVKVDQRALQYETRQTATGVEFRFKQGTLALTISSQVYLLETLPACERRLWEEHENGHVQDFTGLTQKLQQEVQKDSTLKSIFEDVQWFPRDTFNLIQGTIQNSVGSVFSRLTKKATIDRDTSAEYARVRREIARQCHGTGQPTQGNQATGRPTVSNTERQRP
jgi:hypothetical protein